MRILQFILASLGFGAIAVWGSEFLFWSAPPTPVAALDLGLIWLAYSCTAGLALGTLLRFGLGGWRGAFLGGALLGFVAEGIIVGTMYDAFPYQLVWTPLAWHALITGGALVWLARSGAVLGPLRQGLGWLLLGLFGGIWAQYWPAERPMPGSGAIALYLAGTGLAVPLANILLDRLTPLQRPPRWALRVLPILALALWLLDAMAAPSPIRLSCPALILMTGWMIWRLGDAGPLDLGRPVPAWRHLLFLIAPLTTALLAGQAQRIGGLPVNIPIALITGSLGLGCWLWLLWRAVRRRRDGGQPPVTASASARSIAPS
ncbi:hypothetical protein [Frigidibacter sp. ROC022]|uniref:hypothetical protein n=1 Tax=Frigidibacter sp. ROC022 TaxID=2971796 RepID=UPI00215A6302|nr:hypothetical protein [Frigidibacter sp. ROC022]MCR8725363.1 hypothetical protein [Frigidibacter sp. ROC022]